MMTNVNSNYMFEICIYDYHYMGMLNLYSSLFICVRTTYMYMIFLHSCTIVEIKKKIYLYDTLCIFV